MRTEPRFTSEARRALYEVLNASHEYDLVFTCTGKHTFRIQAMNEKRMVIMQYDEVKLVPGDSLTLENVRMRIPLEGLGIDTEAESLGVEAPE